MTEKVDVRIELAQERTRLARERTILAHIRTGFASFLFGAAGLGLFGASLSFAGAAFVLVGIVCIIASGISYARSNQRVSHLLGISNARSTGTGSVALELDDDPIREHRTLATHPANRLHDE